ncbi:MAG: MFS transporter [Actinomycetota bacterium]|nr:MFS transporter [Actinomycetota bacterium]
MDRLDTAPWRGIHTRILLVLGVGWALDAFEVTIINNVLTPLVADFGIDTTRALIGNWTVWFTGLLIGALGFGWLADRLGRKRLFVATLVLYSVATVLAATAPSFEVFLFFRFLTAIGVGGEYSAITSAIGEYMPARYRGRATVVTMNFFSVGAVFASLVALFALGPLSAFFTEQLGIAGWRGALLIGAAAALYGLWARRAIPESPRWLLSQGRTREADAVITTVSGVSRDGRVQGPAVAARRSLRAQLAELVSPPLRRRTAFACTIDFAASLAYYGVTTMLTAFILVAGVVELPAAQVPYVTLTGNVLGALLGGYLLALVVDRYGRKVCLVAAFVISIVGTVGLGLAGTAGSLPLTVLAFTVALLGATTAWIAVYTVVSEIYPTHLRATGVGLMVGAGRIGGLIGVLAPALLVGSLGLLTAVLATVAIFSSGLVAALWWYRNGPEAAGRTLEELAPVGGRV